MPVTRVDSGVGTDTTTAVTAYTITLPAGTVTGDVLLVALNIASVSPAHTVATQPATSTTVLAPFAPGASTISLSVHAYVVPASVPATITYTISAAFFGSITWQRFRGVNTAATINASGRSTGTTLVSTQVAPTITTTLANCFIAGGVALGSAGRIITIPAGWTAGPRATVGRLGAMDHKGAQAVAGATGTATWSYDGATTRSIAWQVALTDLVVTAFSGAQALTGSGTLSTPGTPAMRGALAATGSGALSIVTAVALAGALALTGSGTLAASGSLGAQSFSGAASLSGSGTLAASGRPSVTSPSALTGVGALTTSGSPSAVASVALTGAGTLSGTGTLAVSGSAPTTGSGTLALNGTPRTSGALALTGTGTLSSSGSASGVSSGSVALNGSGTLAIAGTPRATGAANFTGTGTLAATSSAGGLPLVDVTVAGELMPRRWSATLATRTRTGALDVTSSTGTLSTRAKTGALNPRRWEGNLP